METTKPNKAARLAMALTLAATLCVGVGAATPGQAHAYTQIEQIVNDGHGSLNPSYLVIHETANPGASAWNHVRLWSRDYPYAVHYVMDLDGKVVYHTMHDNRKAWHIGNGNNRAVGIELTHATNQADFDRQYAEAVKWAGDYLNKRGWSIDQLISHNDATNWWGGSDHTDPIGYFAQYGKSWSGFKAAVAAYMATGQVSGNAGSNTSGSSANTDNGNGGTASKGTYTVTANALNVRTGPSTGYRVTGTLRYGYKIHSAKPVGNGWYKYQAYSGTRYVYGAYLRAS